jgi:hypothetical protein
MTPHDHESDAIDAVSRYWNALVRDAPTQSGDDNGPLAATVRYLHAQDDAPAPDPAFAARLWQELMDQPHREAVPREQPAGPARHREASRRWRRPMVLLAAALLAIVAAGSVYAGSSLLDRLLSLFYNPVQLHAWHTLGRDVNLSQTACGRTVTISHAYADANRILIGYTFSGKAPKGQTLANPRLTDAHGTVFTTMLDGGGSAPEAGIEGESYAFDASPITGRPSLLALHLTLPWTRLADRAGRVKPGPIACTQPFDFRFTVPFVPSGTVDLHRSVMTEGTGVTFERVVLTPIETRVYVQWITRERALRNIPLIVQLTVNGHALENGTDQSYPNGLTLNVFKPIADERGRATLVASVPRSYLPRGHPQLGPWTIRFTLP